MRPSFGRRSETVAIVLPVVFSIASSARSHGRTEGQQSRTRLHRRERESPGASARRESSQPRAQSSIFAPIASARPWCATIARAGSTILPRAADDRVQREGRKRYPTSARSPCPSTGTSSPTSSTALRSRSIPDSHSFTFEPHGETPISRQLVIHEGKRGASRPLRLRRRTALRGAPRLREPRRSMGRPRIMDRRAARRSASGVGLRAESASRGLRSEP